MMLSAVDVATTLGLQLPEEPRGRHARAPRQGLDPVNAVTAGFLCLVNGHPLPVRTSEHTPGRHADVSDATATIVIRLF